MSNLSEDIISTIYLVSDEELQNPNFVSLREKFKNKEYYCPATHLFTLSEFVEFLQTYYEEKSSLFDDIQTELNFDSLQEAGSYYGIQGNKLEKDISKLLNDKPFLKRYKEKIDDDVLRWISGVSRPIHRSIPTGLVVQQIQKPKN